jgi:hypothetical protein
MRGIAGLLSLVCFVLQIVALQKARAPTHCVVWPFGECEPPMMLGYANLLGPQAMRWAPGIVVLVPLMMWLAFALSSHGAKITALRDGKQRLTGEGIFYLVLFVAVVGYSASRVF